MSKKTKYAFLVIALVIGLVAAGLFTTEAMAGSEWGQKGENRDPGSGWGGGCSPGQEPPCGPPGWAQPPGGQEGGLDQAADILKGSGSSGNSGAWSGQRGQGERETGPPGWAGPPGSGKDPGKGPGKP
jgi:hypothetical protein